MTNSRPTGVKAQAGILRPLSLEVKLASREHVTWILPGDDRSRVRKPTAAGAVVPSLSYLSQLLMLVALPVGRGSPFAESAPGNPSHARGNRQSSAPSAAKHYRHASRAR